MKPLRIAMTGGRGRLAPFIAAHLCAADAEVVSFSRSAGDGFRCTSLLAQSRTLADFDVILHLGWSTVPLTSEERPGVEKTSDLPLLEHMLDSCASARQPPHLVFFSTAAVYGNTSLPATEDSICKPVGNYARAKLRAEEIILYSVWPPSAPAVLFAEDIQRLRLGDKLYQTSGNHSANMSRNS